MAKVLAKGARITGPQRESIASQMAKRYAAGDSVRKIAADNNRSYGSVHKLLKESGVDLRGRGGATRGAAGSPAARKTAARKASAKKTVASKAPAKKAPVKKAAVKKAPAQKVATKKAPAKKTTGKR